MATEDMVEKNEYNVWICELCGREVLGCVEAMALTGHHIANKGISCEGLFYPKER